MNKKIHPKYHGEVEVICACGAKMVTGSTVDGPIKVGICSQCHPFFTGEKRLVDTEGRVDAFARKVEEAQQKQEVQRQVRESVNKKEKKVQERPLTLKELLEQSR